MFKGKCSHCGTAISASVQLPATWQRVEAALHDAHEQANRACNDQWFTDGLYGVAVSLGAEDRPSAVFNICRHAEKGCACYLRCPCGWLLPSGTTACPNPHHAAEVERARQQAVRGAA